MQPGIEFRFQSVHDSALRRHTRQAGESAAVYDHSVVRFTLWAGPGMTGVFCAVINDLQDCWREGAGQAVMNAL